MMPRSAPVLRLATIACVLAGVPAHLVGQDAPRGELKRPVIGRHLFLSSDVVPHPFLQSYLRQSLGVAKAMGLQVPIAAIDGDTVVAIDGDLAFAALEVEYQAGVKDWLAARGRFKLLSRLGTDGTAFLAEGIQVSTDFEFGWLLRLLDTDRVLLSLNADVSRRSYIGMNVGRFVQDVVDGVEDPQLTDNIPVVLGSAGLRVAWGVSPLFGVNAVLEGGYGDALRRTGKDELVYTAGATFDFDLGAVTRVPLGVSVSVMQSSLHEQLDYASDVRTAVVRVGYGGLEDLMIAVDLVGTAVRDVSLDKSIPSVGMTLVTQYYF